MEEQFEKTSTGSTTPPQKDLILTVSKKYDKHSFEKLWEPTIKKKICQYASHYGAFRINVNQNEGVLKGILMTKKDFTDITSQLTKDEDGVLILFGYYEEEVGTAPTVYTNKFFTVVAVGAELQNAGNPTAEKYVIIEDTARNFGKHVPPKNNFDNFPTCP